MSDRIEKELAELIVTLVACEAAGNPYAQGMVRGVRITLEWMATDPDPSAIASIVLRRMGDAGKLEGEVAP